jgi:lysophospholipase L1-like esterase
MIKSKFLPILYLIVSILFFFYIFYKSEIILDGLKHEYYKYHYFFFIILFFFSILSFYLKNELNLNIFIAGCVTIISIYSFEFFFHYKNKSVKVSAYEKKMVGVKDLNNNSNLVPVVYPWMLSNNKNLTIHPVAGISNNKTRFCDESGSLIYYFSDRYGFNNLDSKWDKRIDHMTIGDSFTHGACVNTDETIASQLQKYKKENTINLGIGGTGPLTQHITIKEYIDLINPKTVIWIYYEENDILDFLTEKTTPLLNNYLLDENFLQNLPKKQNKINILLRQTYLNNIKKISKKPEWLPLKDFIKLTKTRNLIFSLTPGNSFTYSLPQDFKKVLLLTKKILNKKNIKLYFVYLPEKNRFKSIDKKDKDFNKKENNFRNYNKVLNLVKKNNIDLINLNKILFRRLENPIKLYNPEGMHLNKEGYDMVAKEISKFIK